VGGHSIGHSELNTVYTGDSDTSDEQINSRLNLANGADRSFWNLLSPI
jgi:hypothetical protein